VVSRGSIYAALHRVNEKAAFRGGLAYSSSEVLLWIEGLFGGLVLHEFDTHQQADAPGVPHRFQSLQFV
jgi:hypothetical protein